MRRDFCIALAVSLALHGGLALAGLFRSSADAAKPAPEAAAPIEVFLAPPPEPEPPDEREYAVDTSGGAPTVAVPQIADSPVALIESPFIQRLQPPPPPGLPSTAGLVTIPVLNGGSANAGLGNLFDLAALDQAPVPTFQPPPVFPYELRRAGLNGHVLIEFIVTAGGDVVQAHAIQASDQRFQEAALQAVRRWRFRPGTKNGVAVNTRMQVPITFNLEN